MDGFNPLDHGLYRNLVEQDTLDTAQWARARAEGGLVGTCRLCSGYLKPEPSNEAGGINWYLARCMLCGHEVASPNGRVLRRSARRTEQPMGWWEWRSDRLSSGVGDA